jgi:ATP-dependent DNA helicase RecG
MTSPPTSHTLSALFAPISVLKGVGPKLLPLLGRLLNVPGKIPRVIDLLFHLPNTIVDRGNLVSVAQTEVGKIATLEITVIAHKFPRYANTRAPYRILCQDESAELMLVYFAGHPNQLAKLFPIGERRLVSGRMDEFKGQKQISHPDYVVSVSQSAALPVLEPIYGLTEGLYLKNLHKLMNEALLQLGSLPEWIDPHFLQKKTWPSFEDALKIIHRPKNIGDAAPEGPARSRLAYDELLAGQMALLLLSRNETRQKGRKILGDGSKIQAILSALPYKLTNAQQRSIEEIHKDMALERAMLRLLQGDVGSGKTIVAMLAIAKAAEAGLQSVMMAPTEILARQHFATLEPLAQKAGMRLSLLTGREKGQTRQAILDDLQSGKIDALIGTHALFQEGVHFFNLGFAIVDEQHRFGVNQRLALSQKGNAIDLLVMTATPIPRTLVLTYYGDMDVSKLDEKPAGRVQIDTRAISFSRTDEVIAALERQIDQGGRIYWICPLISETEKTDFAAVEDRFEDLVRHFGKRVGLLHGKMKAADKDAAMQAFASGETQILVATTVVEVGVDVKEATVIVIEQAERFGLAQLHQLRGRVGRGDKPSTCLLLYDENRITEISRKRLQIMRQTQDGFVIAEADLTLRGQGDIFGTRQSGLPPTRLIDWSVHAGLAQTARSDAHAMFERDRHLSSQRGNAMKILLKIFDKTEVMSFLKAG